MKWRKKLFFFNNNINNKIQGQNGALSIGKLKFAWVHYSRRRLGTACTRSHAVPSWYSRWSDTPTDTMCIRYSRTSPWASGSSDRTWSPGSHCHCMPCNICHSWCTFPKIVNIHSYVIVNFHRILIKITSSIRATTCSLLLRSLYVPILSNATPIMSFILGILLVSAMFNRRFTIGSSPWLVSSFTEL